MNFLDNISVDFHLLDGSIFTAYAYDYLTDLQLNKSLDNSLNSLIGKVSTNTLLLGLNNLFSTFSLTNTTSPLYNKIGKGTKVVLRDTGVVKGTFYITEYDAKEEEVKATVKAVDKLYYILNQTVKELEVSKDVDVKDFIRQVLTGQGISEEKIVIDENIQGVLNYAMSQGVKVSEVLNEFCLATDSYIYVDNNENIVVKSRKITGVVQGILTQDADLYELAVSKSFRNSYNTLILGYSRAKVSEVKELLSLSEEVVNLAETLILANNKVDGLVYDIDHIQLQGGKYDLVDLSCTQEGISLSVKNVGVEPTSLDVTVQGRGIELVDSYVEKQGVGVTERAELTLQSKLIQDRGTADSIATTLYNRLNLDIPSLQCSIMPDDFSIELCQIIKVLTDKLSFVGYIHSFEYTISEGEVELIINLKSVEV